MKPLILLFVCYISLNAQTADTHQFGNVDDITAGQLKDYLSFIASDDLEGRDTPSPGLDIAAKFIATELSRWHFIPKGDHGTYFQRIDLQKSLVDPSVSSLSIDGEKFSFGSDFLSDAEDISISAPLVYVQSGFTFKERNINPYAGLDIKGKIIVIAGGYPKGMKRSDFSGMKRGVDYENPASYAQKAGAVGIIAIPSAYALRSWDRNRKNAEVKGEVRVISFMQTEGKRVPTITLSEGVVDKLFEGEKLPISSMNDRDAIYDVPSFYFSKKKSVSVNVSVEVDTVQSQNIVAVLEGSDPVLQKEYVAFGAHYDHLGVGTPVGSDSIYNGADDDGSGTVALLSMAEAYSHGPKPKRSLLFVWHCGEEKGLWGSKYFTDHPTVPLENIVTQLNIDMIGRSRADSGEGSDNMKVTGHHEVFVIGSKMMSTELGKLNDQVNQSFLDLTFNYSYDDPRDPERLFYRSDHYNYAKHGIPIIFYFDGIHEDYHKVTDEVSKIDFPKYLLVTKTIYAVGWQIANLMHRPVVDKVAHRVFEE